MVSTSNGVVHAVIQAPHVAGDVWILRKQITEALEEYARCADEMERREEVFATYRYHEFAGLR